MLEAYKASCFSVGILGASTFKLPTLQPFRGVIKTTSVEGTVPNQPPALAAPASSQPGQCRRTLSFPAHPSSLSQQDSSHSSHGLSPLKPNTGAELLGCRGAVPRGGQEARPTLPVPTLPVIPFYRCCDKRCQGLANGAKGASLASWAGTGEVFPSS